MALIAGATALCPEAAKAARVRVKGSARIEAQVVVMDSGLELRGKLEDDAGRPVGGAHIRVGRQVLGQHAPLPAPRPCPPTRWDQLHAALNFKHQPGEYAFDTDGAGTFCVQAPGVPHDGTFSIHFEGDSYYPATTLDVAVDSQRPTVVLTFSPEPRRLPLERAQHLVWVETRIEPPLAAKVEPERLPLELIFVPRDAPPRVVDRVSVRPGERAQFEVASRDLGGPGPGRLVARYAGSPAFQAGSAEAVVQRSALVTLKLLEPVAESDSGTGVRLVLAVDSRAGAVPNGSVEALLGGASVGIAPVIAGGATATATFETPRERHVELELRYVASEPWWMPGESLRADVPLKPPSPWRALPWVGAALAVALWFASAWRRPTRSERLALRSERASPSGHASLELVERGPAYSGWRGRLLDAHDGSPIARGRVCIVLPAFGRSGTASETVGDENGEFQLPHVEGTDTEGARLEASAPWHATLSRPVPPAGEVIVQLVARRRALLERLVDWARRRGKPWSQQNEPTPGELARVAQSARASDVEHWARAVERAAYGPEPVDEAYERSVVEREPPAVPAARRDKAQIP